MATDEPMSLLKKKSADYTALFQFMAMSPEDQPSLALEISSPVSWSTCFIERRTLPR